MGGGGKGGCQIFNTLQFSPVYCMWEESKIPFSTFLDLQLFELAMQDSHPSLYFTKTWHHL